MKLVFRVPSHFGSRLLVLIALLLAACTSTPPTLPPTVPAGVTIIPRDEITPAATATPLPVTATAAPEPTTPSDAVACPFTGLPTSQTRLAQLRPLLAQIGNSAAERPQFGLMQADLVFETLSEGGITRFSALYYCQDAPAIAGIRSGRLINLHLVPMFDAIFVHVGASRPVQERYESDARIRASMLDYFRNHPGFTQQPERRRPPFDVFASTDSLWEAARQRNIPMPGNPPPQFTFAETLAGGTPATAFTIRHHSSYWVRYKWNPVGRQWERFLTDEANAGIETAHVDAETGRALIAKNVLVIRAVHVQTDIIEDSLGSRSIEVQLIGSGEAVLFRDGQTYAATWSRANMTDWFTLTLKDGTPLAFTPGNTFIHFYPTDKPIDVTP